MGRGRGGREVRVGIGGVGEEAEGWGEARVGISGGRGGGRGGGRSGEEGGKRAGVEDSLKRRATVS